MNRYQNNCKKESNVIKLFGVPIGERGTDGDDTSSSATAEPPGTTFVRGKVWSENEHISFLEGLEKLGKGDWKGISANFVPTRSPAQIASHAQKYFNRQSVDKMKRRRTSVFDITTPSRNQESKEVDENSFGVSSAAVVSNNANELEEEQRSSLRSYPTYVLVPGWIAVDSKYLNQRNGLPPFFG